MSYLLIKTAIPETHYLLRSNIHQDPAGILDEYHLPEHLFSEEFRANLNKVFFSHQGFV
nr:hypothetical protein [Candidatus Brachybacter algidus]